jgi:hypothetical protein
MEATCSSETSVDFQRTTPRHAGFLLGLFLGPEVGGDISSETSVDFQPTTRRYIPEDITLHSHRCENLES